LFSLQTLCLGVAMLVVFCSFQIVSKRRTNLGVFVAFVGGGSRAGSSGFARWRVVENVCTNTLKYIFIILS